MEYARVHGPRKSRPSPSSRLARIVKKISFLPPRFHDPAPGTLNSAAAEFARAMRADADQPGGCGNITSRLPRGGPPS